MGWADKELKKHRVDKLASEIVNSKAYKEAQQMDKEQNVLSALTRLSFLTCEYLELKHGYKKNGLRTFLKFIVGRMNEIGSDSEYFEEVQEYYKEIGLDVMKELGLTISSENNGI